MKVAVACQSPLLQKALELFLEKHLAPLKKSDIVVKDELCLDDKRCFYVATDTKADLQKPFSKSQLILALEKKYKSLESTSEVKNLGQGGKDFSLLEKKIAQLTQEYQNNILKTVKAFYENK